MTKLVVVVHNVRSAHNVGSIFRSADAFGVNQLYLTGYTPYPKHDTDQRLPHVANAATHKIAKTALGAENTVKWACQADIFDVIKALKKRGYSVVGLEQTASAQQLGDFKPPPELAIIVGAEVSGLDEPVLAACDRHVQIPMAGQKESLNVSVAAAIAMYHVRFN